ncbi:MAG TPA: pyridoxal phosphate-dependent aminotransferase [Bryobacteraceae bacterium]|nr:pyridoxal phosphate-dependent aminotransferase [Bryobacteraceae bacterium]
MQIRHFLLDEWLGQKLKPNSPIEYDLGSSTGPVWTLRELLALGPGNDLERLLNTKLFYTSASGTLELRQALAEANGVDPDDVQILTGAAEALFLVFFASAERNANVVLPSPGFPANDAMAASLGLEIRSYNLRHENAFRVDLDEVRALVDHNTKLVLINSPHNPSGAVWPVAEMQTLHDFCAERGIQLVSDEVYHPIYHGVEGPSGAALPHATVLGDFSKALCLSGLRVGWMIERNAKRRERYTNARSYFTVSNTVLGEQLAALAVRNREAIYARARRVSSANLALLEKVFTDHSDLLDWVRPQGGMTAFPRLRDGSDARPFCQLLAASGILVSPGDCFGMPAHFRIGFAAASDQFPRAINRFTEVLGQLVSGAARSSASESAG